jgi:hypothetical protein
MKFTRVNQLEFAGHGLPAGAGPFVSVKRDHAVIIGTK